MMQNELKTEKFIIFTVAGCYLALPIAQVLQVVHRSTTREFGQAGLVQVGRRMIRLLELHQTLGGLDRVQAAKPQPFLVIAQSLPGEFCAIPVEEPPTLIELPPETMQVLPQSISHNSLLEIVSHAATISQDGVSMIVFRLDIQRSLTLTPVALSPIQTE